MNNKYCQLFIAFVCVSLFACNDAKKEKVANTQADSANTTKKDNNTADVAKPPTINILDTISVGRTVICMKDSSATIKGVGDKLGAIYGQISKEAIAKGKLTVTGQPMAWYKSDKAPYFFEAGIPVSKIPTKLPKGMFIKDVITDSATVAHFFGPYDMLSQGYSAIKERLKDNKRNAKGIPYEMYVGDPLDAQGKPIDPYKVRTDIVFPWK